MDDVARKLREELVGAYRPFVEGRLRARRWPEVPEAIAAGEEWLVAALDELLDTEFSRQPRGPLEVFQEAMSAPTAALEGLGIEPVERDAVAAAALPGDHFDLAPASSADLGDEVWQAHVAWGIAKAAAGRPLVAVHSGNLIDLDRIESSVADRGYRAERFRPEAHHQIAVAFVDLEMPDADEQIRLLVTRSARVVAFGPHVDDLAMTRARSLGADDAVARSVFFRDPASYLPTLA